MAERIYEKTKLKLGGLFSGIGGFELAWTQLGHEVAWMCEIDAKARAVLRERFPGVTIYEDICDIDPAEVEAVDVLSGGSPCQGFSIAGKRTGLEHKESKLFVEYIRVMDGLAERGLQLAVWENVPGILSIKNASGERSFPHVIAAFLGADEPAPLNPKRKWNAGLASYGGREVAWRVLDSQHFGVAQRRRRVFACVTFGNSDNGFEGRTLLVEPDGVRGDSAAGGEAGQEAAGAAAEGASGASWYTSTRHSEYKPGVGTLRSSGGDHGSGGSETLAVVPDVAQCLTTGTGQRYDAETETIIPDMPAVLVTMREGKDGGGKGPLLSEEQSLTLATGNGQTLFQPEPWGFSAGNSEHARSMGEKEGVAPPIRAGASGTNQAPTVGPVAFDEMNFTTDEKTHHVLRAGTPQSTGAVTSYGVRRLTPVECERLQSFPDGWTEPAGSDTARYKTLGNAVTVNVVKWIFKKFVDPGE